MCNPSLLFFPSHGVRRFDIAETYVAIVGRARSARACRTRPPDRALRQRGIRVRRARTRPRQHTFRRTLVPVRSSCRRCPRARHSSRWRDNDRHTNGGGPWQKSLVLASLSAWIHWLLDHAVLVTIAVLAVVGNHGLDPGCEAGRRPGATLGACVTTALCCGAVCVFARHIKVRADCIPFNGPSMRMDGTWVTRVECAGASTILTGGRRAGAAEGAARVARRPASDGRPSDFDDECVRGTKRRPDPRLRVSVCADFALPSRAPRPSARNAITLLPPMGTSYSRASRRPSATDGDDIVVGVPIASAPAAAATSDAASASAASDDVCAASCARRSST